MEIVRHPSDLGTDKKLSLTLNGVNVCDLSFDEFGKHAIGLILIDEVHKFCRVTLAVIDDLPTGESIIDMLLSRKTRLRGSSRLKQCI
jgi:hypothetical protein